MSMVQRVNGYTFKYDEDNNMYECRGEVYYDDEHDPMPEPGLWRAAGLLCQKLGNGECHPHPKGTIAQPEYSEKGWVEVVILKQQTNE